MGSFPCMEDFPTTIRRMQSADVVERAAGLDEFMRMPVVEVVHSGPVFPAACSALVGLFLDTDILLEFMGSHLETGELFLYRQDISESTDVRSIAVLDCFRVCTRYFSRSCGTGCIFRAKHSPKSYTQRFAS
ncbi:hypothetical protein GQ600_14710 [Phytophthora cactorum]|nr:hypothetical protein GQ600_14710 [Phytophthora cactorum]